MPQLTLILWLPSACIIITICYLVYKTLKSIK